MRTRRIRRGLPVSMTTMASFSTTRALTMQRRAHRTSHPEMTKGLAMMNRAPVPEYGPMAMLYIDLAVLYDSIGNQDQVEAVLKEMDSMTQGELAVGLARAKIRLNHSDKEGAERILLELSDRYPKLPSPDPVGGSGIQFETL